MISHSQFLSGAFMLADAALVAWAFWMMPRWSRPGIYFGVTVPAPFASTPEAGSTLRSYRLKAMLHVTIGFALILAGVLRGYWPFLLAGVIWLAVGPLTAFIAGHKRVQPHAIDAATVREAVLERRATHLPGGWIVQLGPFAIQLATAIYLRLHWAEIPSRFPIHWRIDGWQPNGWSVRTPMGVYWPLLVSLVILGGMAATAYGLLRYSRGVAAPGHGSVNEDFAERVGLFLLVMEYFIVTVFSLAALLPLVGIFGAVPGAVLAFLMMPALLILAAWLNKGRAQFESGLASLTAAPIGDGTPDKYWKLGVLYFNPDDAALFVEKRFGIGYTMNFGHASAWIIMALLLLLPVGLVLSALYRR